MLRTPTAVSTFVFANELGGDREFASLNVFVTTLASVATLFVLITLVRSVADGFGRRPSSDDETAMRIGEPSTIARRTP